MKVPFSLFASGGFKSPCEIFFAFAKKRTWAKKSLIDPCHTDKRSLNTICAGVWRRNGDFYEIQCSGRFDNTKKNF